MIRFLIIMAVGLLCGCSAQQKLITQSDSSQDQKVNPYADDEIFATEFSFDMNTGEIKYNLPEKALVRLRVGIRDGGPMLRTLLDWEPREAGLHTEAWDLKDTSGVADYKGNPGLMVILQCVKADAPQTETSDFRRTFHKSPKFRIEFPGAALNMEGIVMLKAKTPLRIWIDPQDKDWLTRTRYEVGLYVDNNFVVEDEEASDPFTYQFDTAKLNNGRHIVTVNIVGYTGEVGAQSFSIEVNNN